MLELLLGNTDYERRSLLDAVLVAASLYTCFGIILLFFGGTLTVVKAKGGRRGGRRASVLQGSAAHGQLGFVEYTHEEEVHSTNDIITCWGTFQRDPLTGCALLPIELQAVINACHLLEKKEHLVQKKVIKKCIKQPQKPLVAAKTIAAKKQPTKPVVITKSKEIQKKADAKKDLVVKKIIQNQSNQQSKRLATGSVATKILEPYNAESKSKNTVNSMVKATILAESVAVVQAPSSNGILPQSQSVCGQQSKLNVEATSNNKPVLVGAECSSTNSYEDDEGESGDGLSVSFMDGQYDSGEMSDIMREAMEDIQEMIDDAWRPLAGWEDAGPVEIEIIVSHKNSFVEPVYKLKSKASAKNLHAMHIVKKLAESGKIRGRTCRIGFT